MQQSQFRVEGRVQGVGFRYATMAMAKELGLNGYVRNEMDGTVLIVAEGKKEQLTRLEAWLKKGPRLALVSKVSVLQGTVQGYREFTIEG